MQKITPFLWFDKEAGEAARLYTAVFKSSKIKNPEVFDDTPSGTVQIYSIDLLGQQVTLMNAGPEFKFNPSVSFIVNYNPSRERDARENLDQAWSKLSEGGTIRMPLDYYPFSEHYGWVEDKFGVSWQLMLTNPEGEERPFIVPSLMFTKDVCGKAEEASDFYLSVFENTRRGLIARYPGGMEPDKEGTIMFTDFMIESNWFAAMDSAREHNFGFNEAISFVVNCINQEEVDYFWEKLTSDGGQESMCGWLKDKYGFSWQIVPSALGELMTANDAEKSKRVMQAMLQMKKIDISKLEKAYNS